MVARIECGSRCKKNRTGSLPRLLVDCCCEWIALHVCSNRRDPSAEDRRQTRHYCGRGGGIRCASHGSDCVLHPAEIVSSSSREYRTWPGRDSMTVQDVVADPFRLAFYAGLGIMLGCTLVSASWELPLIFQRGVARAIGPATSVVALAVRVAEFVALVGCIVYVAKADLDFGIPQSLIVIVASLLVSPLKLIQRR